MMAKLFGKQVQPAESNPDYEEGQETLDELDQDPIDVQEHFQKEVVKLFLSLYKSFEIDKVALKKSLERLKHIGLIKNSKTYLLKATLDEGVRGYKDSRGGGHINAYDGAAVANFYNGLSKNNKRDVLNPDQDYLASEEYVRRMPDEPEGDLDNPVWIQVEHSLYDNIAIQYFPKENCLLFDPPSIYWHGMIAQFSTGIDEGGTFLEQKGRLHPILITEDSDDEILKEIWELAQPQINEINENNKEDSE